jgi:1,4-dihydroxy-2-naphthoate octaprenyltransferase
VIPLGMSLVLSLRAPWALLGLVALLLLIPALRRVLGGGRGPALIPVLRDTGLAMLVWAIGTAVGLAIVAA